jgi:predicted nucleotidyltransferase
MKLLTDCGIEIGRVKRMDKEQIVSKLREHEPELRSAGVVHLLVFGSVARGEDSPQSDVDLMGEFDRSKKLTLLDLNSLELFLSEILTARVDLSDRKMLKGPIRTRAEREAVLAF